MKISHVKRLNSRFEDGAQSPIVIYRISKAVPSDADNDDNASAETRLADETI